MKRAVISFGFLALVGVVASAAVSFDPATGSGFVGKGDVQIVYGWSNKDLQANAASVRFQVSSTVVDESTWECLNTNNNKTQERSRTATTTTQGVVTSVTRERNQVTGFNLFGYGGGGVITNTVTDGPALWSCPNSSSTYSLVQGSEQTTPAGGGSSGLLVSTDSANWNALQ